MAQRLQEWAADELEFRPQGEYVHVRPPNRQELKRICRGNMKAIVETLVQRVRATRNAERIRKNVEAHGKGGGGVSIDDVKVLRRRDELRGRLDELLERERAVAATVASRRSEASALSQQVTERDQALERENSRALLMRAFADRVRRESHLLDEFSSSIDAMSRDCQSTNRVGEEDIAAARSDAAMLAERAAAALRSGMSIESSGGQAGGESSAILPGADALRVATAAATEETAQVRSHIDDIPREVEEHVKRAERDVKPPESVAALYTDGSAPSAFDLVCRAREMHVRTFVSAQRTAQDAESATLRARAATSALIAELGALSFAQPSHREAAERALAAERRRESVDAVKVEIADQLRVLAREREQLAAVQEYARERAAEVRALAERGRETRVLIERMIEDNMQVRLGLRQQRAELRSAAHERVAARGASLRNHASRARGGARREVETFVDTDFRVFELAEGVPTRSMLPHRALAVCAPLHVRFGATSAASAVACAARAMGAVSAAEARESVATSVLAQATAAAENGAETASSHVEKARVAGKGEREVWSSRLSAAARDTELAQDHVVHARTAAREWWEQPAQFTVPWVTYSGRSVAEYVAEWKDAAGSDA